MKQVPYRGSTNVRLYRTKFSRHGNLPLALCVTLLYEHALLHCTYDVRREDGSGRVCQDMQFQRLALYSILFSPGYHSRPVRTAVARQTYGLNHEWESAIVTETFRGLPQYLEANAWLIN